MTPLVYVGTSKGTFLRICPKQQTEEVIYQDAEMAQISDLALTSDASNASLTIGEGEILIIALKAKG